jgi:DNA gyrase inhibitor GyrI
VVAQEYERIKAADAEARLRGDDSPGALEAFIEARKLAVQAIEERAEEAEAWSDKIFSDWLDLSSVRSKRVIRRYAKSPSWNQYL